MENVSHEASKEKHQSYLDPDHGPGPVCRGNRTITGQIASDAGTVDDLENKGTRKNKRMDWRHGRVQYKRRNSTGTYIKNRHQPIGAGKFLKVLLNRDGKHAVQQGHKARSFHDRPCIFPWNVESRLD
ncbi:MAG: hypothetical protein LQ350_002729 [Teloschistes chrysophthalmus]|nr:MAG: hypothetical protein LQ350_002729 [Niorma chrysophthalma]